MTDVTTTTGYASYLSARCDEWRAKHPSRAAELRPLVRRLLGIRPEHISKLAEAASADVENLVIRIMQGWPDEASWEPTTATGRDRALPSGDR